MNSLILPERTPCDFCQYLSGSRPYTILVRDRWTATLVTREQRGDPHLLVIPITHRQSILDLTETELQALAVAVQATAVAIERSHDIQGIAIWQNNGLSVGQVVPHVHFHVAGAREGEATEWGEVPELSTADTDEIAKRIRPFLPTRES